MLTACQVPVVQHGYENSKLQLCKNSTDVRVSDRLYFDGPLGSLAIEEDGTDIAKSLTIIKRAQVSMWGHCACDYIHSDDSSFV
ncbi:hypothetical protein EGR_02191 [Echinococcus granulosus]|uniref:Uncharacterized protein n=1 Tax=Echinococcus granulosus TaxID=6210 RepID=W6UX46_ECHGR|nr:hypothetical protein EGR_02191 [Echinococcus granulosus]EUB63097.1 hypothetical protein EGR_02191 [Echinococcus granulosus]